VIPHEDRLSSSWSIERWVLVALGLLFAAVYFALYPPTYSIVDEQGYLSYGLAISRGTPFADEAGVFAIRSDYVKGHLVPDFAIGTSVLIAPTFLFDWRASFGVIMLVHLLGTTACAVALRRAGIAPLLAALYLFHPVATLYSRTVMSDIPATTLMMAGVAAWLGPRRHPVLAGLAIGLTPHFRFAQAGIVAAFGLAVLLRDLLQSREKGRLQLRTTILFGMGLLPGVLTWMAVNAFLYEGPLSPPISDPLSLSRVPDNLPRYLLSLNLVYPLCLAVAFLHPSRVRLECIVVGTTALLVYSSFSHLYVGFGTLAQMVIGDRFFLPLFPLLVISYAGALERLLGLLPRWRTALLALGIAGLTLAYVGLSLRHQSRLEQQDQIQRAVYAATAEGAFVICDSQVGLEYFFDPIGKRRPYLSLFLDPSHPRYSPALDRAITAEIPDVYLVTGSRHDQTHGTNPALEVARAKGYQLLLVGDEQTDRERVRIYQVTGRNP
jgi:hypothetical protein